MTATFPERGGAVRMVRGGDVVGVGPRIAEGGQGVVFRGVLASGAPVAVKWYRPLPHAAALRTAVAGLAARPRPHPAFAWPLDLVESDQVAGFGYVMPLLPPRFRPLAQVISTSDPLPFRTSAAIGHRIADAFAALHAAGLCYRDISLGNLLVDPDTGEVAIVDNDNVGTDGSAVFVKGTLRFMAPEVLRDEVPPSTVSDLHSLAVILFFLFVHGHPLEGMRSEASYGWGEEGHVSETRLALEHFGLSPLFVFDPSDSSNAPVPGDLRLVWWPVYPRFLRDLFTRTFTVGLTDASLGGRVTEGVWRRALMRLQDSVATCVCGASVFWDADQLERACWHCRAVPPAPLLLDVRNQSLVLAPGAGVSAALLRRDRPWDSVVAAVEAHPSEKGQVVLRNLSTESWTVELPGEEVREVAPGQRLRARPLAVDFGGVRGTIRSAGAGPAEPASPAP